MGVFRKAVKKALPRFLVGPLKRHRSHRRNEKAYGDLSTEQVFTNIYSQGVWGGSLYSGSGSHVGELVTPYVDACREALNQITLREGRKPDAVDLGCGDFSIGSQLRASCGTYVGCDVVEQVIRTNKLRYSDTTFERIDITEDELPQGTVVFVRQVLQHLSNTCIERVLPKLSRYKYVILTEHIPGGRFMANLDKVTGPHIRLDRNSGVVLTETPFYFKCRTHSRLCDVIRQSDNSVLRTELYELD